MLKTSIALLIFFGVLVSVACLVAAPPAVIVTLLLLLCTLPIVVSELPTS